MRTLEPDNDHADIVMYSNIYHNKIYIIFFYSLLEVGGGSDEMGEVFLAAAYAWA